MPAIVVENFDGDVRNKEERDVGNGAQSGD